MLQSNRLQEFEMSYPLCHRGPSLHIRLWWWVQNAMCVQGDVTGLRDVDFRFGIQGAHVSDCPITTACHHVHQTGFLLQLHGLNLGYNTNTSKTLLYWKT